jgi:shikimate kinase
MRAETREAIRAKGISIWLKADYEVLIRRIKRRTDRPMLKTDNPTATLKALIAERYPIYAEADITVLSRDVPHETMVAEILAALADWLGVAARVSDGVLAGGRTA